MSDFRVDRTRQTTGSYAPDAVTETKDKTSQGLLGGSGPAPTPEGGDYSSVLSAMRGFAPTVPLGDFEARLSEVASKMKEARSDADTERVQNQQEIKKQQIVENRQTLEQSRDKMETADGIADAEKISSTVSTALQAIGAGLMIAVGAALMAVPGTQVLGAVLIVGGALMAASAINGVVAATTDSGLGIAGSIAKAFGADDSTIMGVEIGATVALAVGSIAASVAAIVATGGAAAPAAAGALLTSVNTIVGVVGAGVQVGTSAMNVASTVYSYEGTMLQADAKDTQAEMQQGDDFIDQALSHLMDANQRFNALMDEVTGMALETSDFLSQTRFTG